MSTAAHSSALVGDRPGTPRTGWTEGCGSDLWDLPRGWQALGLNVCALQPCPKDTWETCLCWWMCHLHTLELMEIWPCP